MRNLYLTLVFVAITVSLATAKTYRAYDLDGSIKSYQACDSMIVVKFNNSTAKSIPEALALEHTSLRDSATAIPKSSEFFAYLVLPGFEIDSVLLEVRANANVEFAFATLT